MVNLAARRVGKQLRKLADIRRHMQVRPDRDEKLWGGHLWSPSYFAASCGGVTIETLKDYIKNHRSPDKGEGA